MKHFHFWIATFLGIGKIPFAPGTWASLVAVPLFFHLIDYPLIHVGTLVVVYFLGVYTTGQYAKNIGETDPRSAVMDEVLGMGVAMLVIPRDGPFLFDIHFSLLNVYVIMAIVLFRLFDIWKPPPIRRIEKLPGGWGIMTDDLVAGLYALVWVHIGYILVGFINQ
jgi:phosphatidylglycerophosphatase A